MFSLLIEMINFRLAEDLKSKISDLKSLTIDIGTSATIVKTKYKSKFAPFGDGGHALGNEVRYQDLILNDLDDDMSRTGGFMQNTIGRVVRLSKHKRGYTCYMLLFSLLVFGILYVVLKFR